MINEYQEVELLFSTNKVPRYYYENIVSVNKIESGMTNDNYLCTMDNEERYVVRIPGHGTATMINRSEEWLNHQQVQKLGIDVETVFFDKNTGIKISRYVDDFFSLIQKTQDKIPLACQVLKTVHDSKFIFINKFNVAEKLKLYESIAKQHRIDLNHDFYAIKRGFFERKIDGYLSKNANWRPCHNDPVGENFLMDSRGGIYLIDWEYSGMNDPLWDLAAFSLENDLSAAEEAQMLEIYFERVVADKDYWMLFLYKVYQDILWYVWSEIKIHSGVDFKAYADMRLTRAKRNFMNVFKCS